MLIEEALKLIQLAELPATGPPVFWADLGAGSGLFTKALAQRLPRGSTVFAVDKSPDFKLNTVVEGVKIEAFQLDFEAETLPFSGLNGILMANSLHFAADKAKLLQRLKQHLAVDGRFVIVEYDTMRSNPWVPYPIDLAHLQTLFAEAGFQRVKKLGERPSAYGQGNLYACEFGH